MPRKFHNIRQSFSSGVITPRVSGRAGLEGYASALKSCENFIITSQGTAIMREGGQFVDYPKDKTQRFRIFQFLRGGEQNDLLVEVQAGTIRFWIEQNGAPILYTWGDPVEQELTNPYTDEDLDDLYFVNQDKTAVLCCSNHPPIYITFFKDGTIAMEQFPVEKIIDYDYNDVNSPKIEYTDFSWRINVATTFQYSGWIYEAVYGHVSPRRTSAYDPNNPSYNATEMEVMLGLSAQRQGFAMTFVVTPVVGVEGAYDVIATGEGKYLNPRTLPIDDRDAGNTSNGGYLPIQFGPVTQRRFDSIEPLALNSLVTSLYEPVWSYPFYIINDGSYYQCIKTHKKALDNEPGVGAEWEIYWVLIGTDKPVGYDYHFPDGNDWDTDYVTGDILSPWDRGFPTVCSYHEQRLVLMANKDNPTAVYGSAIGEYQNFLTGPNDNDAWLFVLDSSDSPQIKWAVSDDNLLLGTSSGDWILTAEVTITPTDIKAERQNAARSKLVKPVQVEEETFYIEQGGRKLRVTTYTRSKLAFTSSNMGALTEHLISDPGLTRMAVNHSPETLISMVTKDGNMLFMALEKLMNVSAMSQYTTDGQVFDIAGYFSNDEDQDYTYMAVKRNNLWMLERMRYPSNKQSTDLIANGIVMLDSWVSGTVPSNGIITDLPEHLEGKEVFLLVDNGWEVGTYTVTEGQISTNRTEGIYAIGLPYTAQFETFEAEENFNGTGLGTKRRWNSLSTRLLNSALPKVFGQRDRDRTPATPMGDYEGVREGLQDITQSVSGYTDGSIKVLQDRPYPTHIICFFGEYQVEDR